MTQAGQAREPLKSQPQAAPYTAKFEEVSVIASQGIYEIA